MNMTDNDKELAMAIWNNGRPQGMTYSEMFHRYHTAKLEQAVIDFPEWWKAQSTDGLFHEEISLRFSWAKIAYQAGAASQQAKIAALTEENLSLRTEVEQLHRDCEAYLTMNTPIFQELQSETQELKEEVERLKAENADLVEERNEYRLIAENENLRKQLQSAQLDNKRLRELLGRIHASGKAQLKSLGEKMQNAGLQQINLTEDEARVFNAAFGLHKEIAESLSTPIDTSAVDDLLTKLATLEETVTARNRGLDVEIEINQSLRDQLTTVCKALEEARKALEYYAQYPSSRYSYAGTGTAKDALATINAALGEEQKKEGEA